jgi:L-lysine exporter family protein LysE/ArgO
MTTALVSGFLLGLSLILAIGAQNAFVLRQGLRREHVFAVCLACALSDAILITAGVSGFGVVGVMIPWIEPVMRYGGALFLAIYGLRSFRAALLNQGALNPSQADGQSLTRALATCLAFTWLNPHVYLDTVVLLGSISTQYQGFKLEFGAGAVAASFLFFFSLGYGARLLRPVFAMPGAWRVLDVLIGMTMCGLALKLAV